MMRSLYTGVSGLANHQTRMDVVSNNISNVNTVGFKGSRTIFSDTLSQTIQGSASPRTEIGGINAKQIGLGIKASSIDILFTKTSFQTTNVNTDLAINNNGFFIVNKGAQSYYTRAGNFYFDNQGDLLTNEGLHVMGWIADAKGAINTATPLQAIKIPTTSTMPPLQSSKINITGNLSAFSMVSDLAGSSSVTIYDAQGYEHNVFTMYTKINDNTWIAETTVEGAMPGTVQNNIKQLKFDAFGNFISANDCIPDVNGIATGGVIKDVFMGPIMLDQNDLAGYSKEVPFSFVDLDNNNMIRTLTLRVTSNTTNPNNPVWDLQILEDGIVVGSGGCAVSRHYHPLPAVTLADGTNLTFETQALSAPIDPINDNPQYPYAFPSIYISPLGEDFGVIANTIVVAETDNPLIFTPANSVAGPMDVIMDFRKLKQYSSAFYTHSSHDGYPSGILEDKIIDAAGIVSGIYSNGQRLNLAQVAMAIFNNQQGLERAGSTLFTKSNNSGDPIIGTAGSGGIGTLQAGALEMANVDLAEEFTNMIVTQRGYQSNSRVITTSDELLQELLNLKR